MLCGSTFGMKTSGRTFVTPHPCERLGPLWLGEPLVSPRTGIRIWPPNDAVPAQLNLRHATWQN